MDVLRYIEPATGMSTAMSFKDLREWQTNFPTNKLDPVYGRPTSLPLKIDTQWYMSQGPGRYFNPGSFDKLSSILSQSPGQLGLAPGQSKSLSAILSNKNDYTARVSNYSTDVMNADYGMRMLVWGGTSARLEGDIININGKLALTNYKIAPVDDNFNFFPESFLSNPGKAVFNAGARLYLEATGVGVPLDFNKSALSVQGQPYYIEDYARDAAHNRGLKGAFSAAAGFNFLTSIGVTITKRCFLAGTPILKIDGDQIQIQDLKPGDLVASFDCQQSNSQSNGLEERRVTRLYRNISNCIIDLRGVHCTPGHIFATADRSSGGHTIFQTIAQILRSDSSILDYNGRPIRARTGAALGSEADAMVSVIYRDYSMNKTVGSERRILVRAGIPVTAATAANDTALVSTTTLAHQLALHGITALSDGRLQTADGMHHAAVGWPEGGTPFDTHEARNWIVEVEGQPYTPPWIRELVEEDEQQGLRVVGGLPTISSNAASANLL